MFSCHGVLALYEWKIESLVASWLRTSGNADGLGARRKLEMVAACSVLKVILCLVQVGGLFKLWLR